LGDLSAGQFRRESLRFVRNFPLRLAARGASPRYGGGNWFILFSFRVPLFAGGEFSFFGFSRLFHLTGLLFEDAFGFALVRGRARRLAARHLNHEFFSACCREVTRGPAFRDSTPPRESAVPTRPRVLHRLRASADSENWRRVVAPLRLFPGSSALGRPATRCPWSARGPPMICGKPTPFLACPMSVSRQRLYWTGSKLTQRNFFRNQISQRELPPIKVGLC
jgi:hypothetical protein